MDNTLPSLNTLNIFLGTAKRFPFWHYLCVFISFLPSLKTHTHLPNLQRCESSLQSPPVSISIWVRGSHPWLLTTKSPSTFPQNPRGFHSTFPVTQNAHYGLTLKYLESKTIPFSEEIIIYC